MAEKERTKPKGFSTDPDDAVSGGLFGPGKAKFLKCRWGTLKYADGTKATALKVSASRSGEKAALGWTVGNGFTFSADGMTLSPKDGQSGLSTSCNLFHLLKSMKEHGVPQKVYAMLASDPTLIEGLVAELVEKPLPRISNRKGKGDDGKEQKDRTTLVIDKVYAAPWKKGKDEKDEEKEDDEDEEDEDKDDAEADEDNEDEDEDEDEKPAKKKKAKAAVAEDDDDDIPSDADADEDIDEPATEGLIEALTDGPLRLSKVRDAVLAVPAVKKHKQGKAIAARAAEEKFLKKETGWTFNGKVVDLDK